MPDYLAQVTLRIALAFAATWFIWGSTYLAIHFVVRELPPLMVAGLRNLIAGLALYGWMRWRGAPRPTRAQWLQAFIVGSLLLGVGNGAVTWAGRREPSGIIALVVALVPLWLMVFAWFGPHRTRPHLHDLGGVILGFVGILLLVAPAAGAARVISPLGLLVLLASTIAWSAGSLYARSLPPMPRSLAGTGMEMLCGGALLLLAAGVSGDWGRTHVTSLSPMGVLALAYLVVFGSIVGFSAYKWLLAKVRPALAGSYAFVNPVVAVALGWLFAGEAITPRIVLASLCIVGAVAMLSARTYLSRR